MLREEISDGGSHDPSFRQIKAELRDAVRDVATFFVIGTPEFFEVSRVWPCYIRHCRSCSRPRRGQRTRRYLVTRVELALVRASHPRVTDLS